MFAGLFTIHRPANATALRDDRPTPTLNAPDPNNA